MIPHSKLTIEDLGTVREAHRKVIRCRRLLSEARAAAGIHGISYDRVGSRTPNYDSVLESKVVKIVDRERGLRTAQLEMKAARLRLWLILLESVKDARMRLILQYRYVDLMSWQQVSAELGSKEQDTMDAVKKAHKRFIDELKLNSDDRENRENREK